MTAQPPDVRELAINELLAVLQNDTDTYPLAGAVEVPAALEELRRRAAASTGDGPLDVGRTDSRAAAAAALEEVDLPPAPTDTVTELEQAAGPGEADNAAHPHNDRILAANGFAMVRERCMTVAGGVPPLPALEAAIRYLKASRAQALARGAGRDVVDGLDAEVDQFEAVHKFGRALKAIVERHEARARIAPGNGAGA